MRWQVQDVHSISKKFSCHQCGRRYTHKTHLNRHINFECGKEPQFHCKYCGKSFTRKYSMISHIRVFHEPTEGLNIQTY